MTEDRSKQCERISDQAKTIIDAIIIPPAIPSTIKGIREVLFKTLNESYSESTLRRYMKKTLHFSYMKGICRPTKMNSFQNVLSTGLL